MSDQEDHRGHMREIGLRTRLDMLFGAADEALNNEALGNEGPAEPQGKPERCQRSVVCILPGRWVPTRPHNGLSTAPGEDGHQSRCGGVAAAAGEQEAQASARHRIGRSFIKTEALRLFGSLDHRPARRSPYRDKGKQGLRSRLLAAPSPPRPPRRWPCLDRDFPGGPVPEPSTWAMILLGFAGLGWRLWP